MYSNVACMLATSCPRNVFCIYYYFRRSYIGYVYIVLDYVTMDLNLITPSASRMANVKPRLCIMYLTLSLEKLM